MSKNEDANGSTDAADSATDGKPDGKPDAKPDAKSVDLKSEVERYRNEYLYLRAEFENYKKQMIKERSDLRKYGSERLLTELLAVVDIFETALAVEPTPENAANFRKGIELTASSMRTALQRFGLEEVPAHGLPFDPALHEALSSEATDEFPEGHISKVFKKPYKLHDRVIRPGQVVVAKPSARGD